MGIFLVVLLVLWLAGGLLGFLIKGLLWLGILAAIFFFGTLALMAFLKKKDNA